MPRRLRITLAVGLLAFGVAALAGCIYIPTFGKTIERTNLSGQVGDADSKRPVRTGHATAVDVARLLGQPQAASADGRRVAYTWRQLNGYVFGLCDGPDDTHSTLVLHFDEAGVLRRHEILRRRTNAMFEILPFGRDYVWPDDMRFERMPGEQWRPELVGTTRPATVPATGPAVPQ